jgi:CheY-like chemotaxis protein
MLTTIPLVRIGAKFGPRGPGGRSLFSMITERNRPLRVLLVEDSADIREALALLMLSEGIDVVATGLGLAALELAPRVRADVLLTDLGLPDIPGHAVIRRVLNTPERPPRIIAITGFGEPYVTQAKEAGADIVLTKPLAWETLLEHLQPGTERLQRDTAA